MRFIIPQEEEILSLMVADGVLSRDAFEKAVGDKTIVLLDALVTHHQVVPPAAWISWGLQRGLTRLNRTKATFAFVKELKLTEDELTTLLECWLFPFAKNAHNQMLIACAPGWQPTVENIRHLIGEDPIMCVATLPELDAFRAVYSRTA